MNIKKKTIKVVSVLSAFAALALAAEKATEFVIDKIDGIKEAEHKKYEREFAEYIEDTAEKVKDLSTKEIISVLNGDVIMSEDAFEYLLYLLKVDMDDLDINVIDPSELDARLDRFKDCKQFILNNKSHVVHFSENCPHVKITADEYKERCAYIPGDYRPCPDCGMEYVRKCAVRTEAKEV